MSTCERRTINPGDTITGSLLRDYILSALQHDAIRDELNELLFDHVAKGRLHPAVLAASLKPLISELLDAATDEDWQIVAHCLIEDAQETMERGRCG
ncbi:MAG TPA: hypothetical protein VK471_11730 [Solirubrobacterales bacterium]|nr:hypothetical protein [Solirubrobacterales bacterium]